MSASDYMATSPVTTPIERQITSFGRYLRFQNKATNTVTCYVGAARKLAAWVADPEHGQVTDFADITGPHIQEFIIHILETQSDGYANNLFRALQQVANWYANEEGTPNVMAGMKPPMLPEQFTPVVGVEQLQALLKSCEGKGFTQRRDSAIIYLFLDSGLRRTELAVLLVDALDLDHREVTVLGKGRRTRIVSFGRKAAWALDRYLTERAKHLHADAEALWLGEKNRGPMTPSGVQQMIARRGESLGIHLHPHKLRHTWAHLMKAAHISDDEIMQLAGWRSFQMVARYAASTASERARETGRRLAPGDQLGQKRTDA
jgi:integrase/recombinase XerD